MSYSIPPAILLMGVVGVVVASVTIFLYMRYTGFRNRAAFLVVGFLLLWQISHYAIIWSLQPPCFLDRASCHTKKTN